ncbi:MAG TPA: radical SAM protein, partial [Candidatus Altiarchaeales archaeon]|nr:radical SAM protein [Candidatus Altiarchaeales archaeon]
MVNEKLLKKTESLCPRCMEKIPARLVDREGKVIIKKNCPEHGDFEDIYWGNTEGYNRVMRYLHEGTSIENPRTKRDKGCPYDCGLCNEHKSHTILGIIDVTNRCNLNCPICFANANSTGLVYEPSLEQIRKMLENLRKNRPIKSFAFQFSGGEPTIRNDLPEMIKIAKEMGFSYIMVDTNGIKIAEDRKYIKVLHE